MTSGTKSLSGKVALVTGSTSGIGLGIARCLGEQGADLMLNGFGEAEAIEALRTELARDLDVRVEYDGADLSQPTQVAELVRRTETALGGLDILVNNAGIQYTAEIKDFPTERWDAILAINLSAAFHAMQAAIPGMTGKGWGRIVNIASAHGLVGSAQKSAYVAAKHGLVGLTKVGAIELANTGVTVNAICPGWVLTSLVQTQLDARAAREGSDIETVKRALLSEKQSLVRFTLPEGVGGLVVFLCSEAAVTMTGSLVSMDGGWTAA